MNVQIVRKQQMIEVMLTHSVTETNLEHAMPITPHATGKILLKQNS